MTEGEVKNNEVIRIEKRMRNNLKNEKGWKKVKKNKNRWKREEIEVIRVENKDEE